MKKNRLYWTITGLVVVGAIAVILVFQVLQMDMEAFAAQYKNSLVAIPIVIGLYLLKAITLVILPQPVVYLLTGLLFSPLFAFLFTIGCLTMEFTLDYWVGRTFGRRFMDRLLRWLRGRSRTLERALSDQNLERISTIALLRLFPGVSTDSVSLLSGAKGIPFRTYFIGSMIGCAPQAIAVTLMGSSAHDPLSPGLLIPLGAMVIVLVVSMVLKKRFDARPKEEILHEEGEISAPERS